MTFLFILSIMVNMVAILAIVTLYLRQNRLFHFEKNYQAYRKETEDIIHTFVMEMKEENEKIKRLFQNDNESVNELVSVTDHNEFISKRIDQETLEMPQRYLQKTALNAYVSTTPAMTSTMDEMVKTTEKSMDRDRIRMLNEIKGLEKQGMSVEEIAKRMGRGKTEIDLLLKLN